MASGPHTFVTVGVFSAEQFQGNRLAIVAVRGNAISQQRKALIAKEFGYTGTVFIHDALNPSIPRRVEMFTETGEEMSFSGHCILGTAHYLFQFCEPSVTRDRDKQQTAVFMTKSGPIPVLYNALRQIAACSIPQKFHEHTSKVKFDTVLNVQPQIRIVPTVEKCKDKEFPVVSIVKGMTFVLVDLTEAPEVLSALGSSQAPEINLDKEWDSGFVGALYYKKKDALIQTGEPTIHSIQARAITKGFEDPGTGSACSALACYLALNEDTKSSKIPDGSSETDIDQVVTKTADINLNNKATTQRHVYAIQQGVEMGRGCMIAVEVDIILEANGDRKVKSVTLSGKASFFAKGELM